MIKVFTTPSCVYCHALLDWFDDLGLEYSEINALDSPDVQSVPLTIFVDENGTETSVQGFDRPKIKKLLKSGNF